MTKKLHFLILITIILYSSAEAQKDIRPGFVVLNSGDTIRGFIDYRGDLNNASKCTFYRETEAESEVYLPGGIASYRFENGRFYISRIVNIDNKPSNVFLEYLINGITNLYYLRDDRGDFYFVERDGEIYQLSNGVSIVSDGQNQYYKESNLFIGQLKVIYSNAPDLIPRINSARFDRKTMMKLSEDYHNTVCTEKSCIIYAKESPDFIFTFGSVVRFDIITARYEGFMSSFDHQYKLSLKAGAGMNIQLMSINEKLNFMLKLLAGQEKSHGDYTEEPIAGIMNSYSIDFSKIKLIVIPGLKYIFPSGNVKPSASLELEFGQVISQNSEYIIQRYSNGTLVSENVKKDLLNNKFDIGLIGSAGIVTNIKMITLNVDLWGKIGGALYREYGTRAVAADISYYSRIFSAGISTSFYF